MEQPLLSVIIVTVYDTIHLARCLNSITRQVDPPDMEVIVIYHDGVKNITSLDGQFPSVKLFSVTGKQTQANMISQGVQHSRGKIIALTVDHCTPEDDWCSRIVEEQESSPCAAIGGGVEIGIQPRTTVNWAVHFYDYCSYGYFQHPVKKGPAQELSDFNVSYKRDVLMRIKESWVNEFCVPLIHGTLLSLGETLLLTPSLLVYQNRDISFRAASRIAYCRGKVFASMRIPQFSRLRRLFYTLFSCILPLRLVMKLIVEMLPRRSHVGALIRSFPLIALFSILWSFGEFTGFLSGKTDDVIVATEE